MRAHRGARLATLVVAACALLAATAASAAVKRTFVSGTTGDDANPCSIAAPCRTFGTAIAQTLPGGEVVVLDSAGYGGVTISQSVSIVAPRGIYAGVAVLSGDGITINAGPTDVVRLRGLSLVGLGGVNGIVATSVGLLDIANVEVSGFTNRGLDFAAPAAQLTVADSAFSNNGGDGIHVQSAAGRITAIVRGSRFEQNVAAAVAFAANTAGGIFDSSMAGNFDGVSITSGASATIAGCRIVGTGAPTTHGIFADGAGTEVSVSGCAISGMYYGVISEVGAVVDVSDTTVANAIVGFEAHYGATLNAERSTATGGTYGFLASAAGVNVVRMSNCVSTFNTWGVYPQGASTIYSRQNNTIRNNGTDNVAALVNFGAN
jgi:hypothetical protein